MLVQKYNMTSFMRKYQKCAGWMLMSVIFLMSAGYFFMDYNQRSWKSVEHHRTLNNNVHVHVHVQQEQHRPFNESSPSSQPACYRQVQIWTDSYHWGKGESHPCPGLPCGIRQVEDTSFETMQNSDAVLLFHLTKWDWDALHQHRPPGQKWIFCTHESPVHTKKDIIPPEKYRTNTYNYIMSYRRHDGNLFGDFGKFDRSKPTVGMNDSRNWAENKSGVAIWIARNCHSEYMKWKRTEFVRALSKLVSIDLYGNCGDAECPRTEECSRIMRNHKFYLAFENCKCRNYITEKLWRNSYLHDLVPVVYGPPKEDYEIVAPPNSFIHVEDFHSLQELADYLNLLDKNDHLYNKYFEWKKMGSVESIEEGQLFNPKHMCQVVERLLADEKAVDEGTYKPIETPDWETWWWGSCHNDKDYPIKMN